MTARVLNFDEARRRRDSKPPSRSADFMLEGWIENGQVECTCLHGDIPALVKTDFPHFAITAALLDAVWIQDQYSATSKDRPLERMAFLAHFAQGSGGSRVWPLELVTGTNWRHALWWLRQARPVLGSLLRISWYAFRGRHPTSVKP